MRSPVQGWVRYAEPGQPMGFSGGGWGPGRYREYPSPHNSPSFQHSPPPPVPQGSLRSSIQTALHRPVFLFSKCSVSSSGVTLWFSEKHWPENPLNRPVGCRKRCNPGSFWAWMEWTQELSSKRLCSDGPDTRHPQNRPSFPFDRATPPAPSGFASQ